LNILNAPSKIGLMVAALLLLASGILSTVGREAMANRFGLAGYGFLFIEIVLLLVLNFRGNPKRVDEDKS